MRGTQAGFLDSDDRDGIIPAYAGNTNCWRRDTSFRRDHPRVCGEHFVPTIMGSVSLGSSRVCGEHRTLTDENGEPWGSSPRMRGTHQIRDVSADIHGIIPAYAGNTMLTRPGHTQLGDHPRVCGEHGRRARTPHVDRGSSPRMRGTPSMFGGTTADAVDHPRVCGEHISFALLIT